MDNNFHKTWLKYLHDMAWAWHYKYFFDAEEAYSELLVWYSEALNKYDASKGMGFDAFFYFYKHKALHALIDESKAWKGEGVQLVDYSLQINVQSKDAVDALHKMLVELDKVTLTQDAKELLDFVLNNNLTEGYKHNRIGKRTVLDKAHEHLHWTMQRTSNALDCLKNFYGERAFA